MSWFRDGEFEAAPRQDFDRKSHARALLVTLAIVVISLAVVFGLGALGVMPAAEEFSSPPVGIIG
ncbi:MAG: hypothetical protein JOZ05_20340 [Acetobacteraceae bacterium]|nr:hypothetical protein [Acetobacteraceae bacterium]